MKLDKRTSGISWLCDGYDTEEQISVLRISKFSVHLTVLLFKVFAISFKKKLRISAPFQRKFKKILLNFAEI